MIIWRPKGAAIIWQCSAVVTRKNSAHGNHPDPSSNKSPPRTISSKSSVPISRSSARARIFRALCPFHQEKTPSFLVNPTRQSFHCFGCGVGGSVFRFVMEYEHVDFPAAVRRLAARAGIPVVEERGGRSGGRSPARSAAHITEVARRSCGMVPRKPAEAGSRRTGARIFEETRNHERGGEIVAARLRAG